MIRFKAYLGNAKFDLNVGKTKFDFADIGDLPVADSKLYGVVNVSVDNSAKTVTVTFSDLNQTAQRTRSHGRLYCALSCKRRSSTTIGRRAAFQIGTVVNSKYHLRWGIRLQKSLTSSLSVTFTFSEIYNNFSGSLTHASHINACYGGAWVDVKFILSMAYHSSSNIKSRGLHTNWNRARCYLTSDSSAIERIEVSRLST